MTGLKNLEYKSSTENYNELLVEARQMTAVELRSILRLRPAFHLWAVAAYEKALEEKQVSAVPSATPRC